MMKSVFTPLRTCVGKRLRIRSIEVTGRSTAVQDGGLEEDIRATSLAEVSTQTYGDFLPRRISRKGSRGRINVFQPFAGTGTLPLPEGFDGEDRIPSILHLRGLFGSASEVDSRQLWIEITIELQAPALVGGICYAGHPLLPYSVTNGGETSVNFGLPREMRLSWAGPSTGFLDDDAAVTRQQPVSHGGLQFLQSGPVRTSRLVLRLSDFPKFTTEITPDNTEERFGFLIPLLFVYEYSEAVRYVPQVRAGLLAAVKEGGKPRQSADFIFYADAPRKTYMALTAGSLFDTGGRNYVAGPANMVTPFRERYCSPVLEVQERIVFYLEQAEENPRCTAGLCASFVRMSLAGILARPKLRLQIYELDPIDGVSPLDPTPPHENKYARGLYDGVVAGGGALEVTARFDRPSASRYFVVVLTNISEAQGISGGQGQIALRSLSLVQSAHVSVTARPARNRLVRRLNYRLIGDNLAGDYSTLGADGFAFSVERVVAGQRKEVLFAANSLLDLLQSGSARLYANHRYDETIKDESREEVTTEAGGSDHHISKARSAGWRRTEAGKNVGKDIAWPHHRPPPTPAMETNGKDVRHLTFPDNAPDGRHEFASLGNLETRTQSEMIGNEGLGALLDPIRNIVNTIAKENPIVSDPNFWPDPTGGPRLLRDDVPADLPTENRANPDAVKWADVWDGMPNVRRVGLVTNLSIPPLFASPQMFADMVEQIPAALIAFRDMFGTGTLPAGPSLTSAASAAALGTVLGLTVNPLRPGSLDVLLALQLLNGMGIGLSGSAAYFVGGGISFSSAPVLPSLNHTTMSGLTGSISKQAHQAGYSYSQQLSGGFDQNTVETEFLGGFVARTVRRTLNPEKRRSQGAEVEWQGRRTDIVTGSIPLSLTLAALGGKMYRTSDESLCVRFTGGMGNSASMDVWFDVDEEVIRDDY